ncbi:hypothetical protein I4U23_022457 [Adineta vaga]|nr:hypothetical protein I4U23_022457 [Adineta vaga]
MIEGVGIVYLHMNLTPVTSAKLYQRMRSTISYNQPKFDECTTWNTNGITIGNSISFSEPVGLFLSTNNSIYVTDKVNNNVFIWLNNSSSPTNVISNNLISPISIFVTTNGDIYVDNGNQGRVEKRILGSSASTSVMQVDDFCSGLFIDINDTLYCSIYTKDKVMKRWLGDNGTSSILVAGTGTGGSTLDKLNIPRGIFVDMNFNLYVADYSNRRIQMFRPGQRNGITIAGQTSSNTTIKLDGPSDVVLDGDNYIFIVDNNGKKIIRSSQNGFRCIIGCGSSSNIFLDPRRMAFDTYGNIYVTDARQNQVLKFLLSTNSCDTYTTQLSVSTSILKVENTSISMLSTVLSNQLSSPSLNFVASSCTQNKIGFYCNISSTSCQMMKPCQNNGTCFDNNTILNSYNCLCLQGFNGSMCENDYRSCQSNTCLNNGFIFDNIIDR